MSERLKNVADLLANEYSGYHRCVLAEFVLHADDVHFKKDKKTSQIKIHFKSEDQSIKCSAEQLQNLNLYEEDIKNFVAYFLVSRDKLSRIHLYIKRNRYFCGKNAYKHMEKLIAKFGAFLLPPSPWFWLSVTGRTDIADFTSHIFKTITTKIPSFTYLQMLTDLFVKETVIDQDFKSGKEIFDMMFETINFARIDAKVIESQLTRQAAELAFLRCKTTDTESFLNSPFTLIIVHKHGLFSLILLHKYDLLFIWLTLLFSPHFNLYHRTASLWESLCTEKSVPVLCDFKTLTDDFEKNL